MNASAPHNSNNNNNSNNKQKTMATTKQELRAVAKAAVPDMPDAEIERIYTALDVDQTGKVEFDEFFAATLPMVTVAKRELVARASFRALDRSGSGFVTKEMLRQFLIAENSPHGAGGGSGDASTSGQASGDGRESQNGASASASQQPSDASASGLNAGGGGSGGDAVGDMLLQPEFSILHELEDEFKKMDSNGDGVISYEEFKAALTLTPVDEEGGPPLDAEETAADLAFCYQLGDQLMRQSLSVSSRTTSQQPEAAAAGAATSPS